MTLHTASILTLEDYKESRLFLSTILAVVCREYQMPMKAMTSPSRERKLSRARMAYYYLARVLAKRSHTQAGQKVMRVRGTVKSGYSKVLKSPEKFQPELSRCIAALEGRE